MSIKRALVTGTTPDYVDIIRKRYPGRAVFLTDERLRQAAAEERPGPEEEITVDLRNTRVAAKAVSAGSM